MIFIPESLVNSNVLEIMQVSREHMGVYICIASNGIPPPAIKKTKLEVACELNLHFLMQLRTLTC